MEDIQSLKVLFQMCSFCLVIEDRNEISEQISSYALGIRMDEKWMNPQSH